MVVPLVSELILVGPTLGATGTSCMIAGKVVSTELELAPSTLVNMIFALI